MAVQVKRKEGESVESLIRRFTKKVQQSGVLLRAKQVQFRERPKTKRKKREEALYRKRMAQYRDYLRKMGRIEEAEKKGLKLPEDFSL